MKLFKRNRLREHVKKLEFLAEKSAKALTLPLAVSGTLAYLCIILYRHNYVFETINFYMESDINKLTIFPPKNSYMNFKYLP